MPSISGTLGNTGVLYKHNTRPLVCCCLFINQASKPRLTELAVEHTVSCHSWPRVFSRPPSSSSLDDVSTHFSCSTSTDNMSTHLSCWTSTDDMSTHLSCWTSTDDMSTHLSCWTSTDDMSIHLSCWTSTDDLSLALVLTSLAGLLQTI